MSMVEKQLSVGAKVRVVQPMDVPEGSEWDDDKGRISASLKKRLQLQFFRGHAKVMAEIVYVGKESERERLRRKGLVKLRLRDPAGSMLTITAPATCVAKGR